MVVLEFEFEELEEATDNFNPIMLVGKGSHGLVYKGILKHHNDLQVAIKKPSQGLQSLGDNSKLENEIRVLSSLPQNPHLLMLLGTSRDALNHHNLLVTQLMPNGSLHDCLHVATEAPLAWPKRVDTALRIARALQLLHEGKPVVIHRDVKSTNVLFDSHWNAKLADFGLAVLQSDDSPSHQVSQPAGTIGYLDPWYTNPSKLSTKNDIFSFGVLLLEIVSGRKAIDLNKTPSSIVEWAMPLMERQVFDEMRDQRIALPACMVSTIARIVRVAARCVSAKEDKRPAIGEVVKEMEGCTCLVEGVRFRIWRSFLESVGRLRKRRKVGKVIGVDHAPPTSNQKLLLKPVLTNATLGE